MTSKKLQVFAAAFACFVVALFSLSCAPSVSAIQFSRESLSLTVGETRDMTSYVLFTPSTIDDKSFSLASSDESVLSVSDKAVTAVKGGSATLTATSSNGKTATLAVECLYKPLSSIKIEFEGDLVRTVEDVNAIDFSVSLSAGADAAAAQNCIWSVNGKVEKVGAQFSFNPAEIGVYAVSVSTDNGEFSDSVTVRVFAPSSATLYVQDSALLVQNGTFSPVSFFAYTDFDATVFEWFVDGVLSCNERYFKFVPQGVGSYNISGRVDGSSARFLDGQSVTVTVGEARVFDVNVVVDNEYPSVFVEWNDLQIPLDYTVEITAPNGVKREFSTLNATHARRFNGTRFDATDIINPLSDSADKYSVRVRILGGSGMPESAYSVPVEFETLPTRLESYLAAHFWKYDYFITDENELAAYARYTSLTGESSAAYLAFDCENVQEIVSLSASAGVTLTAEVGDFLTLSAEKEYDTVPNMQSGGMNYRKAKFYVPSLRYAGDGMTQRTRDHVFYIDNIQKAQAVSTSDELYLAIENGVRPVCEDAAESLYNYARSLLISIISDDMTNAEKVVAIYDWIMWRADRANVTTDIIAAKEQAQDGAYYLESVLTDRQTVCFYGNSPYLQNASALAYAKAFTVLCNMEGIESYVVTGVVGDFGADKEYTKDDNVFDWAWNMALIDGKWYGFDAALSDFPLEVGVTKMELASHAYAFMNRDFLEIAHHSDNIREVTNIPFAVYGSRAPTGNDVATAARVAVKELAKNYREDIYVAISGNYGLTQERFDPNCAEFFIEDGAAEELIAAATECATENGYRLQSIVQPIYGARDVVWLRIYE